VRNLEVDDAEDPDFGGFYLSLATPSYPNGALRAQIISRNGWTSSRDAFGINSIDPADGATVRSLPDAIRVRFSQDLSANAITLGRVQLLASGNDASFADGNEMAVNPVAVSLDGTEATIDLTGAVPLADTYRLTITRSDELPLELDFVSTFQVNPSRGEPATLTEIQAGVFTPSCALAGCHSAPRPAAGLDLSPGNAFTSIHAPLSGHTLVLPEEPDSSALLTVVRRNWGDPHVNGYLQVGNSKIQMLREWIADGAQDN
jgi:hypothetical protein